MNIKSHFIKVNYQLRDKIALQMWGMWVEANSPHLDGFKCPKEFYLMTEIAMKCLVKEIDEMLLDVIKNRLEDAFNQHD